MVIALTRASRARPAGLRDTETVATVENVRLGLRTWVFMEWCGFEFMCLVSLRFRVLPRLALRFDPTCHLTGAQRCDFMSHRFYNIIGSGERALPVPVAEHWR